MDDDEELDTDSDADDSLDLGQPVIVHTDEGHETGVLLSAGESGVRLRVTHRVVVQEPVLSEAERLGVQAVVAGMTRRDLLVCVIELMGAKAVLLSRSVKEAMVAEDLMGNLLKGKTSVATLKPLTRSVNTFMPWDRIAKIVSHSEWEEEQLLRPYEASLAEKSDS